MPKGGARSRSGPPPDPDALRRDRDAGEWTTLPGAHTGAVPAWPLPDQDEREAELWTQLWTYPQAVMWERQHQQHLVAIYVRRLAEAEARESATNLNTLVRQMADALGLTTPGMRANRWRIASPRTATIPATKENDEAPARRSNVVSMRDRARRAAGGSA